MVQLAGKYVFEKEENIDSYLKTLGLSEDQIKGIVTGHTTLEVKVDGDNYTLSSALGTRTYPVGTEVEEKTPDGKVLKSTVSYSNNKLTIKSAGGERSYEATDSGLILAMTSEGAGSAKITFKRA